MNKYNYYIVYTTSDQMSRVKEVLKTALSPNGGTAFFPCMESYRRGKEELAIVPLFPGYVFIYTDLSVKEIHDLILQKRRENLITIKELGLRDRLSEMNELIPGSDDIADDYVVGGLTEEEEQFMDFLLGVDAGTNKDLTETAEENAASDSDITNASDGMNADEERGEGLLRMSYGYREGKRYIVMQGPLKAYEDRIVNVNMHDRKAYLDVRVNGRVVKAGFEVKPRKYWFPEEDQDGVVLNDGTEINLDDLKKSMESKL